MLPLSIQLYTVRDYIKADGLDSVLERLSKIGFAAVEAGGVEDPVAYKKRLDELGLRCSSYFSALPDEDNVEKEVFAAQTLGVQHYVTGFWIPDFESRSAISATAQKLQKSIDLLKGSGLTLCLHNHWFEFEMVDGRLAADWLMDEVPELNLELDIYWAAHFGDNDVAQLLTERKSRVPLLHVKDGPLVQGQPHTALGAGKMPLQEVLAAGDADVLKWLILELDESGGDMWEDVEASFHYMIDSGLAVGK